jgi:hypothetical protein
MNTHHPTDEFEWIHSVWTGLHGIPRGVAVPVDEFDDLRRAGARFANGVAAFTADVGSVAAPAEYGDGFR